MAIWNVKEINMKNLKIHQLHQKSPLAILKTHPEIKIDFGDVYANWNFPEYGTNWRNGTWYRFAIGLGIALLLYALISGNLLFGVIIVLTGVIFYFQTIQPPLTVNVQITDEGIKVGKNFYSYLDIDTFWMIYEPPEIKNLYIEYKNAFRPRLGIPLQNEKPLEIRDILLKHLPENKEREHEPISDGLARFFKLDHK